jgi:hypothetical protein
MDWTTWAIILIIVLAIWGATTSPALLQPALEVGPLRMDWRDIIALAIVVIVFVGLYTHQLSYERALAILGGLLIGKLVFR